MFARIPLRPLLHDGNVAAVDPAMLAQPLVKGGEERAPDGRIGRPQEANGKRATCLSSHNRRSPSRRQAAGAEIRPAV